MGWFKKKNTVPQDGTGEEVADKQKSALKANEYRIVVKDPWGGSTFVRRKFVAKRYEYDDGVVVLQNNKELFEEIFPGVSGDLNTDDSIKELDLKLLAAKKKLKSILESRDKKTNIKNIQYEIFQLEAQLRKKKFTPDPAFMTLDENKDPTFTFLRKGSSYHPQAEDTNTNYIYTPTDYKKKKSAMTVRNKTQKYTKLAKGILTAGSLIILIAGIIMCSLGGFMMYKGYTYTDSNSAMAKINERFDNAAGLCLETIAIQNKELAETSAEITGVSNYLKDHLEPETKIDGVKPIDFK